MLSFHCSNVTHGSFVISGFVENLPKLLKVMRFVGTLPETNSQFAPENGPKSERKWEVFQSHQFSGARGYVSFREGSFLHSNCMFWAAHFFGKPQKQHYVRPTPKLVGPMATVSFGSWKSGFWKKGSNTTKTAQEKCHMCIYIYIYLVVHQPRISGWKLPVKMPTPPANEALLAH